MTQRGFAYVWILLLVAGFAAASTLAFQAEGSLTTRSREADLLWTGLQFRKAIRDYHADHLNRADRYPRTLEELTDPPGQVTPKRYLRRVFLDPMTGSANWGLVRSPGGGIVGVYSTAAGAPLKKQGFSKDFEHFAKAGRYRDWLFTYDPAGVAGPARP